MKLTNKFNFPQAIVNAIESHTYTGTSSDLTASRIGMPPRIVALEKIHRDKLEADISTMMPILLGQAIHQVLEMGAHGGSITEERLHTTFMGWNISGQPDTLEIEDGRLIDWKSTRVDAFQIKSRENFLEWTQQLNTYRWLLHRSANVTVNFLSVHAFLVDWSPSVATRQKDYPPHAMPQVDIDLWPLEKTESWIAERVKIHQEAMVNLPLCTPEDRWKSDKWAIMKKGQKKALKVFDSREEALPFFSEAGPGASLDFRPGQPRRCQLYCPVSDFCTQWADDPDNHSDDLAALNGE